MESRGGEKSDVVGLVSETEVVIEPSYNWRCADRPILWRENQCGCGPTGNPNCAGTQARELPADRKRRELRVPGKLIERYEPSACALGGIEEPRNRSARCPLNRAGPGSHLHNVP